MTDNQKQNPVLADHIELNLSNYGQHEVERLNSWALGAYDEIERLTGNLREAEARSVQNFVRWANHNGYADDWDVDVTRGYTLAIVDAWNYNGEGARKWQLDVNYHQSHTPAPWVHSPPQRSDRRPDSTPFPWKPSPVSRHVLLPPRQRPDRT